MDSRILAKATIKTRGVLLVTASAFLVMTCYETLKEYVFHGALTLWESHAITIIVTTLITLISTLLIKKWMIDAQQEIQLGAIAFESHESLVVTDAQGVILRVNHAFTRNTGYQSAEVVGKTPAILKSGRHTQDFYLQMWQTIQETGKWDGEVWNRCKNGDVFPKYLRITAIKTDAGKVTHYVGSHADLTVSNSVKDRISNLMYYDSVTGLPNRSLFVDRFEKELLHDLPHGSHAAMLLFDIDNFRNLNDVFGRSACDMLLVRIAEKLSAIATDIFLVSRTGGDEFSILFNGMDHGITETYAALELVARKLKNEFTAPFILNSQQVIVQLSIGITIFERDGTDAEELFKQAELAMYHAKQEGKNCHRFFDAHIRDELRLRLIMESDLRTALDADQFVTYYQIQVDDGGRPIGAESLLRWLHPEKGLISPAKFIPILEESGLIVEVGKKVIETACAQLLEWSRNATTQGLVLAVNVSAKQFHQYDFVSHIDATILRFGINPAMLKLELTEGILIDDFNEVLDKMLALQRTGVQFSLDDFGTGYSSLQYLRRLPLNQIKIDQSFVREIVNNSDDSAIVSTVISMASNLGLDVIAEGVETAEQKNLLFSKGCKYYQGYLFGKPVPIALFNASLARS